MPRITERQCNDDYAIRRTQARKWVGNEICADLEEINDHLKVAWELDRKRESIANHWYGIPDKPTAVPFVSCSNILQTPYFTQETWRGHSQTTPLQSFKAIRTRFKCKPSKEIEELNSVTLKTSSLFSYFTGNTKAASTDRLPMIPQRVLIPDNKFFDSP